MSASMILHPFLDGLVSAGISREDITNACRDWVRGGAAKPSAPVSADAVGDLGHTFLRYFPGCEPPEPDYIPKVLAAAEGNTETATAVFEILRQNRERGEWRDESFPAGLVFWLLKNREHERLRKQGYAIRKQREESVSVAEEIGEPSEPPNGYPAKPPVETAAYAPSATGLAKLKAAIDTLPKRP